MARFNFRLPDIGEGIAEAEIVAWHIKVGDRIEEDQQIADMMTDKATVEMESPVSGIVVELAGEVGDQVPIGSTLVVIEVEGDDVGDATVEATPLAGSERPGVSDRGAATDHEDEFEAQVEAENPGVEEVAANTATVPDATSAQPAPTKSEAPVPAPPSTNGGAAAVKHVLASPAVRARAKDLGIDLASVKHEGAHVRHADLDAFLRYGSGEGYHAPHASRARDDVPVKVIGMRRRIAENMAASKRTIPHFTYVDEIDVTALEAMREQLNANRGGRPKLTCCRS